MKGIEKLVSYCKKYVALQHHCMLYICINGSGVVYGKVILNLYRNNPALRHKIYKIYGQQEINETNLYMNPIVHNIIDTCNPNITIKFVGDDVQLKQKLNENVISTDEFLKEITTISNNDTAFILGCTSATNKENVHIIDI